MARINKKKKRERKRKLDVRLLFRHSLFSELNFVSQHNAFPCFISDVGWGF